ncbi:hypothetical protein MATL_G00115490 [Megalops atlanticus]|uniref:Uncharacterized protein n=1 Tax=Megalops atlanticus TaxID=7932 RepID=A0A9D3PWP3_MEGAT|nr:hypothetical protein MATL_G00115490 [Megalops atlanticus]
MRACAHARLPKANAVLKTRIAGDRGETRRQSEAGRAKGVLSCRVENTFHPSSLQVSNQTEETGGTLNNELKARPVNTSGVCVRRGFLATIWLKLPSVSCCC